MRHCIFLVSVMMVGLPVPLASSQIWSDPVILPGSYVSDAVFLSNGSLVFDTDKIYISHDSLRSYSVFQERRADAFSVDGERLFWVDSCCDGGLYGSNQDGSLSHWLPEIDLNSLWVSNNVIVAGGGAGQLFRSTNGGSTWETINADRLYKNDSDIEEYSETISGIVYQQGGYPKELVALQSGEWVSISTIDPEGLREDESGLYFLVANQNDIMRSQNGAEWETIATVPSGYYSIRSFEILSNVIVASAGSEVYISNDSGLSWTSITDNLVDPSVDLLLIGPDLHIYAFSDDVVQRSVNPVSITSGVAFEEDFDLPTETILEGLFPNPVSNRLTIDVMSHSGDSAELRVVNTLGQLVYYEQIPQTRVGTFRHQIDLPKLASGSYSVQYISGGISTKRSFVLLNQ